MRVQLITQTIGKRRSDLHFFRIINRRTNDIPIPNFTLPKRVLRFHGLDHSRRYLLIESISWSHTSLRQLLRPPVGLPYFPPTRYENVGKARERLFDCVEPFEEDENHAAPDSETASSLDM